MSLSPHPQERDPMSNLPPAQAAPAPPAGEPDPRTALAGKHITFRVGDECYALHIHVVREILGLLPITRVPHAPPDVRGVVNLRGRVIAVTDLRRKFQTPSQEDTDQTVIIVTQLPQEVGEAGEAGETTLGLVVDEVIEVADLRPEDIQLPPSLDSESVGFLAGTAHVEGTLVFLLDLAAAIAHAPGERLPAGAAALPHAPDAPPRREAPTPEDPLAPARAAKEDPS